MKNKKLFWIIGAVALVIVLLICVFPLFSKLYYHRSGAATLLAWQLSKDNFTTEEAFTEYIDKKREENSEEYVFPEDLDLPVSVVEDRYGDVDFYRLSGNGIETPASADIILYFTGGSYIDMPRETHWKYLSRLAEETGCDVLVPLYPRLPDNNAQDCYAALKEALAELLPGEQPDELIFMGDSAGGGLALSLAMQLRDDGVDYCPGKLILICPWLDVTLTNPDIPEIEKKKDPALDSEQLRHLGVLWAGDLSPTDPVISPLYGSFDGLGSITLITGTADLLYPDILKLDEFLSQQGIPHDLVVWEGMFHVFPLFSDFSIPESQEAFDLIVDKALE